MSTFVPGMTLPLVTRGVFQPRFILQNESKRFGLPDANLQPNVLTLIDNASTLIDQHCGRTDGTGQGSLIYSTYVERIPLQARGRNLVRLSFKPLVGLDANTVNTLSASANAPINPTLDPNYNVNWYWTGAQASNSTNANSTVPPQVPGNTLSPILGCSGRYGYARRSEFAIYPDLNYGMNPLMIASFFGGPPGWTPIQINMIDYAVDTGELWLPAGIYLSQYTEIVVAYTSGFHPFFLPSPLKQATAMVIKNLISRAGGISGLRSLIASGAINAAFTPDLIDDNISSILDPFKTVIAF